MITPQENQNLLMQGYTQQEINEAINEVQREQGQPQTLQGNALRHAQISPFAVPQSDNMIKWQLEVDGILERVEHILRGDKLKFDEEGNLIWIKTENPDDQILNEYGVQEIMRILSMYLNRNTILSDYDQPMINYKVMDFGRELNDLFFMKYEAFGLSTLEQRKNVPMIIREIVDVVHSAYQRALHGGERRSLREARQVSQSEQIMPLAQSSSQGSFMNSERGLLNPARWLFGKYK